MIEVSPKQRFLKNWRFIDLFAGIGGFHYALKSFGAKCVLASEIDKKAAKQYFINHGILPEGDIREIKPKNIPLYDILCAGFPCQPFSVSGKQNGFNDPRGSLFFEIVRIVKETTPKVILLENVKNILRHNNGNTLQTIVQELKTCNYTVFIDTLNTSNFGLPQNRERVYFIAFNNEFFKQISFEFPKHNIKSSLRDFLDRAPTKPRYIERDDITYSSKYRESSVKERTNKPIQIGKVSKGRQGERIYHISGHAITLSALGGGIGAKTGIYLIDGKLRKLTGRECARIQGFPEDYILPESELDAHRQFGNSVSVNTIQFILIALAKSIETYERTSVIRLQYS